MNKQWAEWMHGLEWNQVHKIQRTLSFADQIMTVVTMPSSTFSASNKYGDLVITYKFKGEMFRTRLSAKTSRVS